MNDPTREWRLRALTDLWTGDAEGNKQRTIPAGLLGSIRWWFEVLARGLGGTACDPSNDANRCPDQQGKRCVGCELFGCTGWARKFRFEVRDGSGAIMKDQIKRNAEFSLCFTPLRPIAAEEWALLDLTIRLIADYGALGGKTVLKPSDEANRSGLRHHRDYGIVRIEQRPNIQPRSQAELEGYVRNGRWRKPPQQDFAWASLANFWYVNGRRLARQNANQSAFNKVIGRPEPKCQAANGDYSWLAGQRPDRIRNVDAASKKVFSFRSPPRTFGFVNPGVVTLNKMEQRLAQVWGSLGPSDFVTGDAILARLTTHAGVAP